ncbi:MULTISPECIES: tRNA preQ1(34) S-adenosylmethionine ribosyltransferase-isomerase QueA [Rhodomicrobium]|uniref:tRNA preQ1(34) S-adenosylmethionine ribosyltransferase-isomerase QueA n=1 Tax=Rhodomicrobium TaxID=1068 RepID=UPI000B4ACA13|nr:MULTISPECIES: tRNA preQ1(34) S-adenosylmethionine ribosyltransferase-isomerase QueA [Rhodomicrobium]
MRVDAFDFELPEARIALRPAEPREAARLLIVAPGGEPELADRRMADLPEFLRPGDVLVFNNTRVLPAQLVARHLGRPEGSTPIGITLHKRISDTEWHAFARPAKKLKTGDRLAFGPDFQAVVRERFDAGELALVFDAGDTPFETRLAEHGKMPLPPYIASRRPADARDLDDYQTVFATEPGAVAAPTAGLHFTDALNAKLAAAGIGTALLTLHVGAGTFLPVKAEDTADHRMHAEWGTLSAETAARLNSARAEGGRIVAVGTTSLRLLESAAAEDGRIEPFSGDTAIFITPGYRFKAADLLITNFHLPRSTLFMLVSAFSGLDLMQRAYAHAIADGYRFYSYGDACLLAPEPLRA